MKRGRGNIEADSAYRALRRYALLIGLVRKGSLVAERIQLLCFPDCCCMGDIELSSDMTTEQIAEIIEAEHKRMCNKELCHNGTDPRGLSLMFDLPDVQRFLV